MNLSFKDILNYEFIDYLNNALEKLKFEDRNRLVFEILESENLSDYDFLEEFVLKYKKLGVKIAIDDFGRVVFKILCHHQISPKILS